MKGEILKELRKERRLTQTALAKKLHVTRNTISNYENNVATPDDEMKCKIAELFNISLDYLLGLVREERPLHREEKGFILYMNFPEEANREAREFMEKLKDKYHI